MSEMRSEIYSIGSNDDLSEISSFTSTPMGALPDGAISNMRNDPFYEEQQQRFETELFA